MLSPTTGIVRHRTRNTSRSKSLRPHPPLRNLFVPKHLETKLHSRKNPPLSNSFRICDLLVPLDSRPYPPLSKSFVFNTVSKTLQKAPLSKSFGLKRLQTSKKAPLSNSFRITLLHKYYISCPAHHPRERVSGPEIGGWRQ